MDGLPERLRQKLDGCSAHVLVEYLTERLGVAPVDPEYLPPPGLRELVELLGERMGAGEGHWRLEFVFGDGRLERWFAHEGGSHGERRARVAAFGPAGIPLTVRDLA